MKINTRLQVTIDIYASAEFGCVTIGEGNHVEIPNDVQMGCLIWDERVPIVNMTRHWLRYCIEVTSQHHSVKNELMDLMKFSSTPKHRYSWGSVAEQEIHDEEIGGEYKMMYTESEIDAGSAENDDESENDEDGVDKDAVPETHAAPEKHTRPENYIKSEYAEPEGEAGPEENDESSSTTTNRSYGMYSISSSMASPRSKFGRLSSILQGDANRTTPWPFVFAFDSLVGELGPNERRDLRLSFHPTEDFTYTVDATCYLTCDRDNYPKIVNALPITVEGTGCRTQFQVS